MPGKRTKKVTAKAGKKKEEEKVIPSFPPYFYYGLLFLEIAFVFGVRLRLMNMPLERDEGEYAYMGQLLLRGIPPYKIAYNMKLPGTYVSYAAIMGVFGETRSAIHLGLAFINIATIVLVYLLGRRLSGQAGGITASATYGVTSLSPSVLGFAGHATHFVVLGSTAGALLLLKATEREGKLRPFFLSGLLMGIAFIMKQPGALFIAFGAVYVVFTEWQRRSSWRVMGRALGLYCLGAALPYALTCILLTYAGAFPAFWFWTVSYAAQYASQVRLAVGIHIFWSTLHDVCMPAIWLWILGGFGLIACLWNREERSDAQFVLVFFAFSFLAVCPGLLFRPHYFILLLPALSLLVAIAISTGIRLIKEFSSSRVTVCVPAMAFLLALGAAIYQQRAFFFELDPTGACRMVYGVNPFPEAILIADYIRNHSTADARIAVLGSEPEIYFYANRLSATGYIYTYPLMEEQKYAEDMQRQMIDEIEKGQPEYLVVVQMQDSWLVHPNSQMRIFSWANRYAGEHYDLAGTANIHPASTEYRWDENAKTPAAHAPLSVLVFKRKSS